MSTKTNTMTVQKVYENFSAGNGRRSRRPDMKALMDLYADDVEWQTPTMRGVQFSGKKTGRQGVKDFFAAISTELEPIKFEAREFIAQGDTVVALGHYSWRVKATGKEFSSDFAHVCTVRDGRIVRFHEYMDTAAEVSAHRKR